MKPIKLAQWGSTIALFVMALYVLIVGGFILFKCPDRLPGLIQQVTVLGLFIAPEKLAAFFGPVLKRKQENGK